MKKIDGQPEFLGVWFFCTPSTLHGRSKVTKIKIWKILIWKCILLIEGNCIKSFRIFKIMNYKKLEGNRKHLEDRFIPCLPFTHKTEKLYFISHIRVSVLRSRGVVLTSNKFNVLDIFIDDWIGTIWIRVHINHIWYFHKSYIWHDNYCQLIFYNVS